MKSIQKPTKKRFTTLIDEELLSQIKLISYFTNQKLNECINSSLQHYIIDFETKNNTTLNSIIDLQNNFTQLSTNKIPTEEVEVEDTKVVSKKPQSKYICFYFIQNKIRMFFNILFLSKILDLNTYFFQITTIYDL